MTSPDLKEPVAPSDVVYLRFVPLSAVSVTSSVSLWKLLEPVVDAALRLGAFSASRFSRKTAVFAPIVPESFPPSTFQSAEAASFTISV